jgi:hypothetical protein
VSTNSKFRRTLALVLAGGSLAIGVPAALAAGGGDGSDAGGAATAPAPGFVQDEQQNRPDRDCPERGGDQGDGGGSSSDATTTPAI